MSTKVTDLEEFAFAQIWRPYWPMHPDAPPHVAGTTPESYGDRLRHTLTETVKTLQDNPAFREAVIGRLWRMSICFPAYVNHPLAEYIKQQVKEAKTNAE